MWSPPDWLLLLTLGLSAGDCGLWCATGTLHSGAAPTVEKSKSVSVKIWCWWMIAMNTVSKTKLLNDTDHKRGSFVRESSSNLDSVPTTSACYLRKLIKKTVLLHFSEVCNAINHDILNLWSRFSSLLTSPSFSFRLDCSSRSLARSPSLSILIRSLSSSEDFSCLSMLEHRSFNTRFCSISKENNHISMIFI